MEPAERTALLRTIGLEIPEQGFVLHISGNQWYKNPKGVLRYTDPMPPVAARPRRFGWLAPPQRTLALERPPFGKFTCQELTKRAGSTPAFVAGAPTIQSGAGARQLAA